MQPRPTALGVELNVLSREHIVCVSSLKGHLKGPHYRYCGVFSSSQVKTESCSVLWSRFLATLIVEQFVEVPNVFQDRVPAVGLSNRSLTPSRRGLHCFLPGQRSTAFCGADLRNSHYFTN